MFSGVLKLARCQHSLAVTRHGFYVDHSHRPVLAPATLAALPSTRAIPNLDVFYVADPISSIRQLPRKKILCQRCDLFLQSEASKPRMLDEATM